MSEAASLPTGVFAALPRSARRAGVRLVASAADRATVALRIDGAAPGEVDAGAIALLVEAAGTAAAGLTRTVHLSVSFPRSVPEDPVNAEARVLRRSGDLCLCDVEVRDWNGDLVARGSVALQG